MNNNFNRYLNNYRNRNQDIHNYFRSEIINMYVDFQYGNNFNSLFNISNMLDPFNNNHNFNTIQNLNEISTLTLLDDFLNSYHEYLSLEDLDNSYEELQTLSDENNVKVVVPEEGINKIKESLFEPNQFKNDNCAICLEDFKKSEKIKILDCKHNFHSDCINPWLSQYSNKCPLCRDENKNKKYINN